MDKGFYLKIPTSWDVLSNVKKSKRKAPDEKPAEIRGTYRTVVIDPP